MISSQPIQSTSLASPLMTGKKLLIVEDSKELTQVIVNRAKKKYGLKCFEDNTGEKCIALCKQEKPDLIILDIGLPKISGLSLLRQIRNDEDIKDIPIIVYSAYSYKELVEECVDLGIQSYYTKSEPLSNLFTLIEENLSQA